MCSHCSPCTSYGVALTHHLAGKKKKWLVFCQWNKPNWLTKETGGASELVQRRGQDHVVGREKGRAGLVATGCEVSLATDLSVVLAEMS